MSARAVSPPAGWKRPIAGRLAGWRRRFQWASALLLDDVHHLALHPEAQDDLSALISAMLDAGRPVVFTSSVPMTVLTGLAPTLLQVMASGGILDRHEAQGIIGLDSISGATVTVIAQNQVMLRSGIEIARQVGIIKPTIRKQAVFTDIKEPPSWNAVIKEGSDKRLTVSPDEVGIEGEGPYIDMYFGYLNAPWVGKSVLW